MAKFTLKLTTFIPAKRVTLYDTSTTLVQYAGDNRREEWNGTYRTQQIFNIDTGPTNYSVVASKDTGTTTEYAINKSTGKEIYRTSKKAPTTGITYKKRVEGGFLYIDATVSVGNPLQPDAPNIDYKFTIKSTRSGIIRLTGKHDGFPAYELWKKVDGQTPKKLWSRLPGSNDSSLSLFPPMDKSVDKNLGS